MTHHPDPSASRLLPSDSPFDPAFTTSQGAPKPAVWNTTLFVKIQLYFPGHDFILFPHALLIAAWLLAAGDAALRLDMAGCGADGCRRRGRKQSPLHGLGSASAGTGFHRFERPQRPVVPDLAGGGHACGRTCLRAGAIAAVALLALAVAVSRLVLHAHTPSEAVLGGLWGALLAAIFLWLTRWPVAAPAEGRWIALSLLLPLVAAYGQTFPSNPLLGWVALRLSGHRAIYTRRELEVPARTCKPEPGNAGPRPSAAESERQAGVSTTNHLC